MDDFAEPSFLRDPTEHPCALAAGFGACVGQVLTCRWDPVYADGLLVRAGIVIRLCEHHQGEFAKICSTEAPRTPLHEAVGNAIEELVGDTEAAVAHSTEVPHPLWHRRN